MEQGDIMGKELENTTDYIGLTDHKGAEEMRKSAEKQQDIANKFTEDEITFQREQYADWKKIYGPLQEDLGTYFKNITGDAIAAKQITQIQAGSQVAQRQTDQALAQRGISNSGLAAATLSQNIYNTEMQKANVRASADDFANQQKAGFLGLGLGQGTQMLGIQAGVSSSGAGVAGGMASNMVSNSTALSQTSMGTMGTIIGAGIGAGFSSTSNTSKGG